MHGPLSSPRPNVPDGGLANINLHIPNPYFAYAITAEGRPDHGVSVETIVKRPVTLGLTGQDGATTPGSTVQFVVDYGTPNLKDDSSKNGNAGAFVIRTGNDFSGNDAKNGNYLIGFGNEDLPYQAFMPQPNMTYQIYPKNVFYLNSVDLQKGSLIDTKQTGPALKLDLSSLPRSINVTHSQNGELTLEH